jgi:hypothetical protein
MATTYAGDPNNYPDAITLPSGGDLVRAASVSTALEGLADRTANLARRLRLVDIVVDKTDDASSSHNTTTTVMPGGAFLDILNLVDLADLQIGDLIELDATFWVHTSGSGGVYLRVGNTGGAGIVINSAIPEQSVDEWAHNREVHIHTYYEIPDAARAGAQSLYLQVRGEPVTLEIKTPQVVIAKVYRRS